MVHAKKIFNLVLSGGGIKGIAFIGAVEAAENKGVSFANIAGVSAGALAGSFMGAGYTASELESILNKFDFGDISLVNIKKKVPVVAKYMKFSSAYRYNGEKSIECFLREQYMGTRGGIPISREGPSTERGKILDNIITYSNDGCLFDGDYLEEWVAKVLLARGIRTFADFRGGVRDNVNPRGYKVRMTAVDVNRRRVIILPDDISFYGIEPDKLEVSRAVRMSTSVPFAFKPVELKKREGNLLKTYSIVDGGVLDGFPTWLVPNYGNITPIGFKLEGEDKKLLSVDTPLNVLKALLSTVHNIGVPKKVHGLKYIAKINTGKISFLDFNLSNEEKLYLYNEGKISATKLLNSLDSRTMNMRNQINIFCDWLFNRRM